MKFENYMLSEGYKDSVLIAEVDMTNFGELPLPVWERIYNGYYFYIDGVQFLFTGSHVGDGKWLIKFGVHEGYGKINVELSGKHETRNTILVLKNVIKCFEMFDERYDPKQVTFTANKKSRQKTYERIIESLMKIPKFQRYGFPRRIYSNTGVVTYIVGKQ